MLTSIFFWVFAVVGIASGLAFVLNRKVIYSALLLTLNFFSIAGLYLTLEAEFIAIVQVIVYAGAIMVTFLFVIMLLNMRDEKQVKFDWKRGLAFAFSFGFLAEMSYVFASLPKVGKSETFEYGKVESIGQVLMTDYVLPFEMVSVILLVALIGAIVISKRTLTEN